MVSSLSGFPASRTPHDTSVERTSLFHAPTRLPGSPAAILSVTSAPSSQVTGSESPSGEMLWVLGATPRHRQPRECNHPGRGAKILFSIPAIHHGVIENFVKCPTGIHNPYPRVIEPVN